MGKKTRKNLLSILALIFIGNLIAYIMDPTFISIPKIWLYNSIFSILIGYPMMKLSEFIIRRFGSKIKWEDNPGKRILATLGVVILLAVLVTFLINYIFLLNIQGISPAEYVRKTLYLILIQILIVVYIFSLLTAIEFFRLWKESLIKEQSMQQKTLKLQLEALKNQVNPHFLFNSLNTLTTLVHKDSELAVKFILQLSDSYRYLLEQKEKKAVEWQVERQFVENYVSLQQMRFGSNLRVCIETTGSIDFFVIPLSVQMLLENAIKHNVITADRPLQIDLFTVGNYLVVRNNLQVKSIPISSEKVGLENIRQQYRLLTGQEVEVSQTPDYFTVKLPFLFQSFSEA